jgi:hypothetical protein
MNIKMKAITVEGIEVVLHFDFKIHNLIVEQVTEDVTYIEYSGNGCAGNLSVLTDTIEEID